MPGPSPAQRWAMIGWLHDPRLKPLALRPSPAWLWSPDATQRAVGQSDRRRDLRRADAGRACRPHLRPRAHRRRRSRAHRRRRCAPMVRCGSSGCADSAPAMGRTLTCACARITLADGATARADRRGRARRARAFAAERVARLLAGERRAGRGVRRRRRAHRRDARRRARIDRRRTCRSTRSAR